ncbi:hypothetical protein [Microbacterium sp.]|uniref:hypothetical protein n=1 Tax=Microbacterium sp. TaxID=51671 RepID=UPI003C7816B0
MNPDALVTAALGLCALAVTVLLFRSSGKLTFVFWCVTMFFVPVWVGVSVGNFFLSAIVGVTLLAIATGGKRLRPSPADAVVAVFAALVLGLWVLGLVALSHMVIALLEWTVPYVWGRVAFARVGLPFIGKTIAALAVAAAGLAVVEFATGTNIFLLIPLHGGPFEEWGTLQYRGGMLRAEGAFGHSIALGAALAMSASFLLATRWRTPVKLAGLAVVIAGIVVTFSRIGLVSLVIAVGITLVILPGLTRATRFWVIASGAIAAVFIVPFVFDVLLTAGEEASGSADYRSAMIALLPVLKPLGSPGDWTSLTLDGSYFGYFANSVDNAILLMALRFGYIPALLALAGAVAITILAVRRSTSSPAAIAVASQVPALVSVALITQYGSLLWFFAGVAVSWAAQPRSASVQPAGVAEDVQRVRDDLNDGHGYRVRDQRADHAE